MLLHLSILLINIVSAVSTATEQEQKVTLQNILPHPYTTEASLRQPHTGSGSLDMIATAGVQRFRFPEAPIESLTSLRYYPTSDRGDSKGNLENIPPKGKNDMHDITETETRENTGGGRLTCKASCTP